MPLTPVLYKLKIPVKGVDQILLIGVVEYASPEVIKANIRTRIQVHVAITKMDIEKYERVDREGRDADDNNIGGFTTAS